jgi:diaminopimelate epimerase
MKIHFYKYQATGNDFVLVDNRKQHVALSAGQIGTICDRRFGVGADGVILLENDPSLDFKIVYYNGDGTQSLCGNGCRSAVDLASKLGLVKDDQTRFAAHDGPHSAALEKGDVIKLKMNDVSEIREVRGGYFLDTGSPHFVKVVENVMQYPVVEEGRALRYADEFKPAGANANFVELRDNNTVFVRTYERGVEDETLSCGTGVTAVCLAVSRLGYTSPVTVKVKGGVLAVEFKSGQTGTFHDISLIGPAKLVFEGDLEL